MFKTCYMLSVFLNLRNEVPIAKQGAKGTRIDLI